MGILTTTKGYFAFCGLYIVCLALALAVCGLYGRDVHHAHGSGEYADSKWVYAVVVGVLSAVTSVVYLLPLVVRRAGLAAAAWNLVLFILWIALFGVFASMYIKKDPVGDDHIRRMKNAVWVDLVNALLWLVAAFGAAGYWWKHRDARSQFTGRAHV